MIQYKAKKGGVVNPKDAQKVGLHLETISKKHNGKIATENVLEDAKNKKSPIHKYFDWNDKSASDKYRLQQARQLMGSIMEVVVIRKERKVVRSYYNIIDVKKKNRYVPVKIALTTKSYTNQLIEEAKDHIARLSTTLDLFLKFN